MYLFVVRITCMETELYPLHPLQQHLGVVPQCSARIGHDEHPDSMPNSLIHLSLPFCPAHQHLRFLPISQVASSSFAIFGYSVKWSIISALATYLRHTNYPLSPLLSGCSSPRFALFKSARRTGQQHRDSQSASKWVSVWGGLASVK